MSAYDSALEKTAGLLNDIRRGCAEVVRRGRHVTILQDRLPAYADLLAGEEVGHLEMDPSLHHLGHGEETTAFLITLDAVNFGSGYFPDILPDPRLSGYRTVAAALTTHFSQYGAITAGELSRMETERAAAIFGLDSSHPPALELAALFSRSWRDLGAFLLGRFGGSFGELVASARGSAESLVELLATMPLYRDVARYGSRTVPFYKRSQITAADLYIAFRGEGPGFFADIDALTLFADNLVPHVLRLDGILRYTPDLGARIDAGILLPPGSPEEVEIRAAAVVVAELLVERLRHKGKVANSLWVDNRLWHRGQLPQYRLHPRHRTRTPFY